MVAGGARGAGVWEWQQGEEPGSLRGQRARCHTWWPLRHGRNPILSTDVAQEQNWIEETGSHRTFMSAWFRGHLVLMAKLMEQPRDWGAEVAGSESPGPCGQGAQGPGCGWVGQACVGQGCSGCWQVWDQGWAVCQAPKSSGSVAGTWGMVGGCGKQGTLGWMVYPTSMMLWSLGRQPCWEVADGWSGCAHTGAGLPLSPV